MLSRCYVLFCVKLVRNERAKNRITKGHFRSPNIPFPRSMRSRWKRPGCGSRQAYRQRSRFQRMTLRYDTLTGHYLIFKFEFSWVTMTSMGKTEGIFLNLQCDCHRVASIFLKLINQHTYFSTWLPDLTAL